MPGLLAFFAGLAAIAGTAILHSAYTLQPMVEAAHRVVPLKLTNVLVGAVPPLFVGVVVMILVGYVADQLFEGHV